MNIPVPHVGFERRTRLFDIHHFCSHFPLKWVFCWCQGSVSRWDVWSTAEKRGITDVKQNFTPLAERWTVHVPAVWIFHKTQDHFLGLAHFATTNFMTKIVPLFKNNGIISNYFMLNNGIVPNYLMSLRLRMTRYFKKQQKKNLNYYSNFKHYRVYITLMSSCPPALLTPSCPFSISGARKFIELAAKMDALSI